MCLSKTARNADAQGVPYDEVSSKRGSAHENRLADDPISLVSQGDFKDHAEDDVAWKKKKSDLYWVSLSFSPSISFMPFY